MRKADLDHHIILTFMTSFSCCLYITGWGQRYPAVSKDTIVLSKRKEQQYKDQRDLIDLAMMVFHKDPDKRLDSTNGHNRKLHLSASPILEYTLSTELTTGIAAGGAFITDITRSTNVSSFVGAIKYTQKKQFLLPIQSSVWSPGNRYNFLGDWRYLNFPQDTYGIGGFTTTADQYIVTYKYVRFYEFALKHIGNYFYVGPGYQLDHHWGIAELGVSAGRITDFQTYGFSKQSTSSGIALDIVYDSRKNSINPEGGAAYANVEFLQNSTALGSSSNWNWMLIDLRKYFKVARTSVLAFWFYGVLTLDGNPPYLDLPGTGSDTYNNTGRGYEQGRFIGKRYVDLESEFRFPITRNGLLGGVVFCNAGSVSEPGNNRFEVVYPGFGIGLRIKFNKFSNTNACLDYGIGTKGSRGFFGNLGEVF
jgi:hypothetical protein